MEIVQTVWNAAYCWPIDRYIVAKPWPPPASPVSVASPVSASSVDTCARLCYLFRQVEDIIRSELTADKRAIIHNLIDLAAEIVTKNRHIASRADTLKRFRGGKVRKEKKWSRYVSEC